MMVYVIMFLFYIFRYSAAERYAEALEILQSGALVQLNSGQVISYTVSL